VPEWRASRSSAPRPRSRRFTTARPGIVIGRRGAEAERIRTDPQKLSGKQIQPQHPRSENPRGRGPARRTRELRAASVLASHSVVPCARPAGVPNAPRPSRAFESRSLVVSVVQK
jgi:hypothetical protein